MKIVNRKEFLKLPENTVFSKYKPCYFENIEIKCKSIKDFDYMYQSIVDAVDCDDSLENMEILEKAEQSGESFNLDLDCQNRDGCFDQDQLFAVWEKVDVAYLLARLSRCI